MRSRSAPATNRSAASGADERLRRKRYYVEQVRKLLAHQFEVDENTITMDTNIADDLGADSLDVVELVMSIEDAYGITIEDEKAAELTTVRQVVDYLEKNA